MSKDRKGIWDSLFGADPSPEQQRISDQMMTTARALEEAISDLMADGTGQAGSFRNRAHSLVDRLADLQDRFDAAEERSDKRPLTAKAVGAHSVYR